MPFYAPGRLAFWSASLEGNSLMFCERFHTCPHHSASRSTMASCPDEGMTGFTVDIFSRLSSSGLGVFGLGPVLRGGDRRLRSEGSGVQPPFEILRSKRCVLHLVSRCEVLPPFWPTTLASSATGPGHEKALPRSQISMLHISRYYTYTYTSIHEYTCTYTYVPIYVVCIYMHIYTCIHII